MCPSFCLPASSTSPTQFIRLPTFPHILMKQNCAKYSVATSPSDYWELLSPKESQSQSLLPINVYMYASMPLLHNTKQKFGYLHTILNNIFMSQEQKGEFIHAFQKAQRSYHGFARLATLFRNKRAVVQMTHDLFMNPIQSEHRHVMTIIQHNAKYFFTVMDLRKIIETALANSPNFISDPLVVKNPYNNMPFSKAILYSIYFFIKHSDIVMSPLFHQYFLANFSLTAFKRENSVLVRNFAIQREIHSGDVNYLYNVSKIMLHNRNLKHNKNCQISVHKEFPKERLVAIMRPYLMLYYTSLYSLDISARYAAEDKLEMELNRVQQTNSHFGRKFIRRNILSDVPTVTFNDECCGISYSSEYNTSHLAADDDDVDDDDDEEEVVVRRAVRRQPSPNVVMDNDDESEEEDYDW